MRMLVHPAPRRARVLRAATLALVLAGYADLARGGITAAPLLLVCGYLVLVPLTILLD
jgi:hypothetical protein